MEDQTQGPNSPNHGSETTEPLRSRWTPKPEQILILESIFNSGMVNPPKDDTVRIRKLLEKFGSVADANVFYWFQNRRSRSRRRQRQIQATLAHGHGGAIPSATSYAPSPSSCYGGSSSAAAVVGNDGADDPFSLSGQMGVPEMELNSSLASSILCPSNTSNLQYQSGLISVFINGIPTEVPRGPLDMKAMFGEDSVLVHSSGVAVPFNEYGISLQSLEHGETYFLVSRPT